MASEKRNIITFQPSVTGEIIAKELSLRKRTKQKAPKRKCMEEAIILAFGHKYPKLCPPELLARVKAGGSI